MHNTVKIRDVVKIIGGGTPSKNEKRFYNNGTIRWATVGDMNKDLIVDTELKITDDGIKESSTNIVPIDAIIIATRVGLGKVCYIKSETAINQDLKGLLPNKKHLLKEYLFYFFKSISKYIIENGTGATVKGVKLDFINDIDIPLPPLQEQQRIVSKLDLLFDKIDRSIALHVSNMNEADAFMGSVLNDVFEELEEKYEKKQLSELVSKLGDGLHGTPKYDTNGEYYFINGANVKDNKIIVNENTKKVNEEEYLKYKKELTDRTIFVSINGTIGNVGLYNNEKCILGKSTCYFNLLEDIDKIYVTYVIKNGEFQQYIEENSTGATIKNVSLKTMRGYKVIFPPLSIQQKTVKYLDEISEKIDKVKQVQKEKMVSLKALKASILDRAFRGEL